MIRATPLLLREVGSLTASRQFAIAATSAATKSAEWEKAKPFEEIPGPRRLPLIGNWWRFMPGGEFHNLTAGKLRDHVIQTYGKICRLDGIPGRNPWLFLLDPEMSEKVYRNEGVYPERHGNASIAYYRQVYRKDVYEKTGDAVTYQGQEWHNFRSKVNPTMMKPKNAKMYVGPIDEVANDMIVRMKELRDDKGELPPDFLNTINKWALESISLVALDSRIGCLDPNLRKDSATQKMIDAVHTVFDCMFLLDFRPPIWKLVSTPTWRRFVKSLDYIFDFSFERVQAAMKRIKRRPPEEQGEVSVLEQLLLRHENPQLACVMAMDMMIAGIDTTGNAVSILLMLLAKNPEKQEKLYEEIRTLLPESKTQSITAQKLEEMKYLKACVKESMRIIAIAPGIMRRVLKDDFVLGGYRIPQGTDVVMFHNDMANMEEQFPNPKKFIPERWLKNHDGSSEAQKAHPFAFMPFGFGPRMCVGRRFAELEMETLVAKVIRNFLIEYHHGDIQIKQVMLSYVTSPLNLKLIDRPS